MNGLLDGPVPFVVLAYFVGAVPMGLLIARSRGIDLRAVGSGNIGATNAVRALGGRWGLVVFVLDACKAGAPVAIAIAMLGRETSPWIAATGLAAVVGHMFPLYLKFRGGKGVACAFGAFVVVDPFVAAGGLVMYAQGLALTRRSAVGSLTAVSAMVLAVVIADRPWDEQALVSIVAVLIWVRHVENVRQLRAEARERAASAPIR